MPSRALKSHPDVLYGMLAAALDHDLPGAAGSIEETAVRTAFH